MKLSKREKKLIAGNRRARLTDIKDQLLDEKAKTAKLEKALTVVRNELTTYGNNHQTWEHINYSITIIENALV